MISVWRAGDGKGGLIQSSKLTQGRTPHKLPIAVIGLVLAVAFLALSQPHWFRKLPWPGRTVSRQARHIVLISIDTIRADYMRLYSPTGAPTPRMERIAEEGFLFENVITQVPFTLPSHCTIFTGRYPFAHHVRDNVGLLPESETTLPEFLQQAGYHTGGFVGSIVLESGTGIAQGFDHYDDGFSLADVRFTDLGGVQKSADEVLEEFKLWMRQRNTDQRFFAFLHFYDPHAPYEPPSAFLEGVTDFAPKNMYRGEISYVDSVIGKVYDLLSEEGVLDSTLLVITGDHGEMLGEHQEEGHGFFIYQPVLRVPLLVRIPESPGGINIQNQVELVDLMPTIMDLVDLPIPAGAQGRSLLPLLVNGSSDTHELAYAESYFASGQYGTSPLLSIQDGAYKYIESARPELYDLQNDATEARNLISARPQRAAEMKSALEELVRNYETSSRTTSPGRPSSLGNERIERLAALGYLSGGRAEKDGSSLDPKDYVDVWNATIRAGAALREGDHQTALRTVAKATRRSDVSVEALLIKGKALLGLGDFEQALASLERARVLEPNRLAVKLALADFYEVTKDYRMAAATYDELLERDFSVLVMQRYCNLLKQANEMDAALQLVNEALTKGLVLDIHQQALGEIYTNLGQYEQALTVYQRLVREFPNNYKARLGVANVHLLQGDVSGALEVLETARLRFPDQPELLFRLGILYSKAGDNEREMEVFKALLQSEKHKPRGYFYLAKAVLDSEGEPSLVVQLAKRGLDLEPTDELRLFGHYLLMDGYRMLGEPQKSYAEFEAAQRLEHRLKEKGTE